MVRLENLSRIVKERGLTAHDLVRDVGGRYTYWRDLLAGEKSFGEKIARKLEDRLNLARYSLDGARAEDANGEQQLPDDVQELADHLASYATPSERAAAVTAAWTGLDLYESRMKLRAKQASAPKKSQGRGR